MYKQLIIRKIFAAVLLLVFSFSITPTIILHNWIADHTDAAKKTGNCDKEQLSTEKRYCHCDNIVAESPFTETDDLIIPVPQRSFDAEPVSLVVSIISTARFYFSLRGPPVV
ncbi:MAG TPA: hypothetical protein PKC54_04430 [Ferruginibacter sp.]|nr:hypothetical protein [Ferruginibacter sp.]